MTWVGRRAEYRTGGPPRSERGDLARRAVVVGTVVAAAVVFCAVLAVVLPPAKGGPGHGGWATFLGSAPAAKSKSDDSDGDSGSGKKKDSDSSSGDDSGDDSGDSGDSGDDSKDSDSKDSDSDDSKGSDDKKSGGSSSGGSSGRSPSGGSFGGGSPSGGSSAGGSSAGGSSGRGSFGGGSGAGPGGSVGPTGMASPGNGPSAGSGGFNGPGGSNGPGGFNRSAPPAGGGAQASVGSGTGTMQVTCSAVVTDQAGLSNALARANPNDVICVRNLRQFTDGGGAAGSYGSPGANGSAGPSNNGRSYGPGGSSGFGGGSNNNSGLRGSTGATNSASPSAFSQGQQKQLRIWLTGYSWQDNTPPGSSTVSQPILHREAGGTGTYTDPITVAVPGKGGGIWSAGSRFYLPTVKRYVIVEDTGASAAPSGQDGHLDMWIGGQGGSRSATDACMDKITGTNVPAVLNPPPGLPVIQGPVFGDQGCNVPSSAAP